MLCVFNSPETLVLSIKCFYKVYTNSIFSLDILPIYKHNIFTKPILALFDVYRYINKNMSVLQPQSELSFLSSLLCLSIDARFLVVHISAHVYYLGLALDTKRTFGSPIHNQFYLFYIFNQLFKPNNANIKQRKVQTECLKFQVNCTY